MLLVDGVQCSVSGYNLQSEQQLLPSEIYSPAMGTKGNIIRSEPVEGLEEDSCLSVIPVYRTSIRDSYCISRVTTLRLKKTSLWSVDSNILDYRGFYVFRKTGSVMTNNLEFSDDAGNTLASYEKKTTCGASIAVVMLGSAPSPEQAVATLEHRFWGKNSSVNIYLHEVEGELQRVVPGPDIKVKGDIGGYCYQFYMSGTKIAQVDLSPENQMYILEIGPWVDIAFIAICASAIDMLHVRAKLSLLDHLLFCVGSMPCFPCLHNPDSDTE